MIQLDPIQVVLLTMMIACLFLTLGMLIGRMIYKDTQVKLPANRQQFHRAERHFKMMNETEIVPTKSLPPDLFKTHEIEAPDRSYIKFLHVDRVTIHHSIEMNEGDKVKIFETGGKCNERTGRHIINSVTVSDHPYYQLQKVATVK